MILGFCRAAIFVGKMHYLHIPGTLYKDKTKLVWMKERSLNVKKSREQTRKEKRLSKEVNKMSPLANKEVAKWTCYFTS